MLTFDGRHQWAALALFIGMVLDMLDGKVARLTRTTTQFGVEFDSLADVVSFGVAPALLLYSWALQPLGRVGAGAAFLYVICGALRLARFNVLSGVTDRRYFIGLPIPGAAGVVASAILFFDEPDFGRAGLFALACATYVVAFLMISNIRYYSFKDLNFAKRHPFGVLLVAAVGILIVFAHPEHLRLHPVLRVRGVGSRAMAPAPAARARAADGAARGRPGPGTGRGMTGLAPRAVARRAREERR